jgi:hypothetical protein
MVMKTLIERTERLIAAILEAMQDEIDSSYDSSGAVDDDAVSSHLNNDDHHESAVLCW